MATLTYAVGSVVQHPTRQEWGRGLVQAVDQNRLLVQWDGRTEPASWMHLNHVALPLADDQTAPVFKRRPAAPRKSNARPRARATAPVPIGVDGNIKFFTTIFPGGFTDPAYIGGTKKHDGGERAYKLAASEQLRLTILDRRPWDLSSDAAIVELAAAARADVTASQNLLFTTESIAFHEALKDIPAARAYFSALFSLLDAPTPDASTFDPYIAAVQGLPSREDGTAPTRWTILTLLPFLAQPDRHIFIKPEVTRAAADSMGFPLDLTTRLFWPTYLQVLEMARQLLEALAPLGARDMIDVQSFIWVTQSSVYKKAGMISSTASE